MIQITIKVMFEQVFNKQITLMVVICMYFQIMITMTTEGMVLHQ